MEKKIKNFEDYSIDEHGNVYSNEKIIYKKYKKSGAISKILKKRKKLSPSDNGTGYKMVNFVKNGKRYAKYVHRLVAESFLENPSNLKEVNHKDGDKSNNDISNLEWVTHQENVLHCLRYIGRRANYRTKSVVCVETGKKYKSIKEASEKTSTNYTGISHCICGISKTAGGMHWKLC